jgi:hypothetical protein
MRQAVRDAAGLDDDRREDLEAELLGATKALREVDGEVRALPPGEPMPTALATRIAGQLESLANTGKDATSVIDSIKGLAARLGPLIDGIGSLLG